jgi:hypothetical protein
MGRTIEGPLGLAMTEDGDYLAGRYAILVDEGNVFANPDLHTDFHCWIKLAGMWIEGAIRHGNKMYSIERPKGCYSGYYFQALDGSVCGLCIGMKVRIV